MPHRDGIHIEEEELPGIGMRDDFMTRKGRRVGVITLRNGTRELLVYKKGDPDAVSETVTLTESEADILAEYLGTRLVVERLSRVTEQIDGLDSDKITIRRGAPAAGRTLEQMDVKRKTGAAIVAIWRDKEVEASPMPDFVLHSGDSLILIGTDEAIASAKKVING